MDGELQPVDTTNWYPKVMRKDYTVGMNITESEVDDPDVLYYENYACVQRATIPATDRGRRPASHFLPARRGLPVAFGEGADPDGQQHLQRSAVRRPLDRQLAAMAGSTARGRRKEADIG
jgi:hypothetical protein